jgi:hypothetical protein
MDVVRMLVAAGARDDAAQHEVRGGQHAINSSMPRGRAMGHRSGTLRCLLSSSMVAFSWLILAIRLISLVGLMLFRHNMNFWGHPGWLGTSHNSKAHHSAQHSTVAHHSLEQGMGIRKRHLLALQKLGVRNDHPLPTHSSRGIVVEMASLWKDS